MNRTLLAFGLTCIFTFVVLHLLGLRDYVSVLSGTPGPGGESGVFAAATGLFYAVSWFAAVLCAPVIFLAIAFHQGMERAERMIRGASKA